MYYLQVATFFADISPYPMLGCIFYGNHLNGLHKTSRLIANAKQMLDDGPINYTIDLPSSKTLKPS